MKGMQIFTHSLRQVTGNLAAAVRVSGGLYLVQMAVLLLMAGLGMRSMMGEQHMAGFGLGAAVSAVVMVMTGLWIAVAWHRFVLLVEQPAGVIPPFHGPQIRAYFLLALIYGVAIVVLGMVLGAVLGAVVMPTAMWGGPIVMLLVFSVLIQVPLFMVSFRLTAALPGAAIGVKHPVGAGWEATKGEWLTMLQLAIIAAVLIWAINLVSVFVLSGIPVLGFVWQIVTGWLVMMVGVSVLTTLYGHYIQKRPLL